MLFLELPTGGLADALGRKPVAALSAVFSLLSLGVLLAAHSVAVLALVAFLQGSFRALDSGPLQAWYIDATIAADPDADIEHGLSRSEAVICGSLGAGALLASAAPLYLTRAHVPDADVHGVTHAGHEGILA